MTDKEITIPWGKVVESDQIWSEKAHKWYEVISAVRSMDGAMVKIRARRVAKPIIRPATDPARVKRGVTGEAVDLIEIIFSGPISPETLTFGGAGQVIAETVDEQLESEDSQ